ncbi:MAG: pyruvate synthase [Candidatus Caldarchaeum sp.]|nr:pyruvate synthase [Candidatus Caldarchaeum sp.]
MRQVEMMTGNTAAAWAARLADVDYVPAYPITPQTEIIETIAKWISEGLMKAKLVQLESEHSMLTAAGTASLTGARVFTATSSQGLLYGFEMLYSIAGWRAPIVLVNVSRGIASPITLEPDHNDVLAARDSGFMQFHAETCQEVLDLILIAYRVSEDKQIMLPSIVNMDGFYLSFTREPVQLPSTKTVADFLPPYEAFQPFRSHTSVVKAPPVLGGHIYTYFKHNVHESMNRALDVFEKAAEEYRQLTERDLRLCEGFMLEDAEYVLVMSNSFTTAGKKAVKLLRERNIAAGLLKITAVRPFPKKQVADALRNRKAVAVFDQNISLGLGGIFYNEIAGTLYHVKNRPETILSVVGGLGGKYTAVEEFEAIFDLLLHPEKIDSNKPVFLFRKDELRDVERALELAGCGGWFG